MAEDIDDLAKRLQTVEGRVDKITTSLDALTGSVAELTKRVGQGFDQVTAAIVEQRHYTEFAVTQLGGQVDARFDQVDARFDRLEHKVDRVIEHLLPPTDDGSAQA